MKTDPCRNLAAVAIILILVLEAILASHIDLFATFWLHPDWWALNVEWQVILIQGLLVAAWVLYLECLTAPPAMQCCTVPDAILARDTAIFGPPPGPRLCESPPASRIIVQCAYCKRYRLGIVWLESSISSDAWLKQSRTRISHGICPECAAAEEANFQDAMYDLNRAAKHRSH